ncbi:glycoside hydrolase family 6 protein [Phytophthora sojae]|uniref:Glycoside hydrolase family 6 protein n=1 Tax=Phytophthora sojae (strain P6497) TaxID=1094619 RepID=G4ZXN2_PHYSP|nr:glycoside hydrolase family 6 protein [Phytophthora sojae]EGZ12595.1 glycoside hydrolase family 6 protein [Phytophthora sojae]|eukprot:XP_009532928.1 glycoside hydrolase family 6 protein [Phytophthora sojae]
MTPLLPLFLIVLGLLGGVARAADTLCSLPPVTYAAAKLAHPDSAFALDQLESMGIATWYSDRDVNGNATQTALNLVASCPESSRLSVVVYGLPNKDCDAGYSNGNGTVKTGAGYEEFITNLTAIVGDRKVLYVLEPDAVGLLANKGCAVEYGYQSNLTMAIARLSENPNAEIYLDVGFWTLERSDTADIVAQIVKELTQAGRVKGIALNTSNYRSTTQIAELCTNFQTAVGSTDIHCVIDTSRNFQEFANASSTEWCNVRKAGIGAPPTNVTDLDNIDYLVYVKPPGDSDGTCVDQSADAMQGPPAGEFFNDHFIKLWNQGYFVNQQQMATIYDPDAESSGNTAPASPWFTTMVVLTTIMLMGM